MPLRRKVSRFLKQKKPPEPGPFVFHPTPGDVPAPRATGQRVSADELRDLRELIRHRYALDVYIWSKRYVKDFSRPEVEEKMRQADAALDSIKRRVTAWDRRELFASDLEYHKFCEIKERVFEPGKVCWMETPPWDMPEHNARWSTLPIPVETG